MIENINMIQGVADGLESLPVASAITNFTSAVSGIEQYATDPAVLDLINQIQALLLELSLYAN